MMKTSLFVDAPIVKRGRKLQTILLDFLVVLILSVVLLFAGDALVSATGGQKAATNAIKTNEDSLKAIVKESHLDEFAPTGENQGVEMDSNYYILRLTLGSLLHGGKTRDELSKNLYEGVDPIDANNEYCYAYYCDFKIEKNSGFLQGYRDNSGLSYYRGLLLKGFENNFLPDGFPYLNMDSATLIDESFRNVQYKEGLTLRNNLKNHYSKLLLDAIGDLEHGYEPYINARKAYENSYRTLWLIKIGEAFGGYALAMIICFLVLPLIFKNGNTVSSKMLLTPFRRIGGQEPGIGNLLIRFVILLASYVLAPVLALLMLYGSSAPEFLSIPVFGAIPVFTFMIYSFVLMLVSYLFTFLPNGRKQTLSELASHLIQVDGKDVKPE